MPKDHCTHMQFLIKQKKKKKKDDIRITCAETAKYNKWKRSSNLLLYCKGEKKNMPVFKNSINISWGKLIYLCICILIYHC